MQNSQLFSNDRKRIEAEAWSGVTDFDSPLSRFSDIYIKECDDFLLKTSIHEYNLHNKRIVNVGGGHGMEAEFLIRNGAKDVTIVDIAIEQLRSARVRKEKHQLDGLDVILGDAEELPFKNKVFDLGYIYEALHHFTDHKSGISEICRVSKEVIFVDIMNALITRSLNYLGLFRKEWCGIEPNRLNEKEVRNILDDQKMKVKITYYFIPSYYGNNILILHCVKLFTKVINFAIGRSKRIAPLLGNIAIIEGKPNYDNNDSGI